MLFRRFEPPPPPKKKVKSSGLIKNRRGLYLFAKSALPLLLKSVPDSPNPPTMVVTGATASTRGGAFLSSFVVGKFAKRGLVQSLAREFHPKGVHVAHAIIDAVIDIPKSKGFSVNDGAPDGKLSPDAVSLSHKQEKQLCMRSKRAPCPLYIIWTADICQIADEYWHLHTQHRSGFTQEIELRPYVEKF